MSHEIALPRTEKERSKEELFVTDHARIFSREHLQQFDADLHVLEALLANRIKAIAEREKDVPPISLLQIEAPYLPEGTPYAQLVEKYNLTLGERVLLITALLPHTQPAFFTELLSGSTNPLNLEYKALGGFI